MEIVTATYIVPIGSEPIRDGALAVELGVIRAIGPRPALTAQYPNAVVRDFPQQVLLPGLVNAHCHIDLTHFACPDPVEPTPARATGESSNPPAGASGESAHVQWLIHSIQYRQAVPLEQLVAGIRQGLNRALRSGTTCVGACSGYDGVAELVKAAGLRAVIFPEIFASGPGNRAQDRFESALALIEKCGDASPEQIRIGLGPLAPYLVSRPFLRIVSQHATQAALPLTIHAAESFAEMEFFFDSSGPIGTALFPAIGWGAAAGSDLPPPFHKTPIQYLSDIGFLAAAPLLVGCIHVSDQDIKKLAQSGCRVVYCPRANRAFQHGTFPWRKLADQGVAIGLGTEATGGSDDGNMWEEMRAALETKGLSAKAILEMATLGGSKALGWDHRIGSLAVGKAADFLVCDCPEAAEPPLLYEALIRQTTPQRVRQTVIDGQWVKPT